MADGTQPQAPVPNDRGSRPSEAKLLAIFTKPIEAISATDVATLVSEAWPEGYQVEFKEALPSKKGSDHPWMTGGHDVGDYARDQILSEVLAFANAQGGTLILGIKETRDKPPRAGSISALPRVGELARRFEDQARSIIDPPLPRLQVRAVETEPDRGIVIFRTGPSRLAPHRLSTTRDCYKRHGASTMVMTMREIQDMTLNVARGLAGVDATFRRSQEAFTKWGASRVGKFTALSAFRATAVPIEEVPDPGRLSDQPGLFPALRSFTFNVGANKLNASVPIHNWIDAPVIRGMSRRAETDGGYFLQQVHQSGLSEIWMALNLRKHPEEKGPGHVALHHFYVMGGALQALHTADILRRHVGAPDAEYALEVEITRFGTQTVPFVYFGFFADRLGFDRYEVFGAPFVFPRISVGSRASFGDAMNLLDLDIYDALGTVRPHRLPISVDP
jgi:hypothetical protein